MKKKMRRLWRQATADKKKFGILVTMVAVGLLLWGRLMLLEKVPRVATADPSTATANAGAVVAGTGTGDQAGEDAVVLPPLPVVAVDLDESLSLDLFAFRHNRYKALPPRDIREGGVDSGQALDDVEVRRRELEELVKDLRLQSVIQGSTPICVINGRLLRVGDSISGFEIASFGNRSAKVTRDGLTFTLNMLNK